MHDHACYSRLLFKDPGRGAPIPRNFAARPIWLGQCRREVGSKVVAGRFFGMYQGSSAVYLPEFRKLSQIVSESCPDMSGPFRLPCPLW